MLSAISFILPPYLSSTYYVPGTGLSPVDQMVQKTNLIPAFTELHLSKKKDIETHNYNKGSWGSGKRKYIWKHIAGGCVIV